MAQLGVNIDHVATIRQARGIMYPDPVKAAELCEIAGADSIVCHLREDRRHIQDADLWRLRKNIKTRLNLEMALSEEIIDIALSVKPDQVTIVPEKRKELTTEGGLDVVRYKRKIIAMLGKMKARNIDVSLFIDPETRQIKEAGGMGIKFIELHTGEYANAKTRRGAEKEFLRLKKSAYLAEELSIAVFAGHGLNYENVKPLRGISVIREYNIGHSIIARSIFVGIEKAVKEMKSLTI